MEDNHIGFRYGDSYDEAWGYSGHMNIHHSIAANNSRFNAWNMVFAKGKAKKEIGAPRPGAINVTCSDIAAPASPVELEQTAAGHPSCPVVGADAAAAAGGADTKNGGSSGSDKKAGAADAAAADAATGRVGPDLENSFPDEFLWKFEFNCTELRLGKLLEQGAYKKLFKGKWRGRDVAVFRFKFDLEHEGTPTQEKLLALAAGLERRSILRHPSLASILGVCLSEGIITMVQEFFVGQRISGSGGQPPAGLKHVLADELLQVSVAMQLAQGLAYMHYGSPLGRVVHNDFKPANVLLSPDGQRVKIVDFDSAMVRSRKPLLVKVPPNGNGCGRRSCPGVEKYWNAPECCRCSNWDERYEVWNLGIMMMLMVSGQYPHYKNTWTAQDYYEKLGAGKELPVVPNTVFPALRAIINSCLVDVDKRPQSDKVARSLEKLYQAKLAERQGRT